MMDVNLININSFARRTAIAVIAAAVGGTAVDERGGRPMVDRLGGLRAADGEGARRGAGRG